jgi:hypothetical protein
MPHVSYRITAGDNVRTAPVEQFLREVTALRERGFVDAPRGPLTLEALDQDGRLCWRAYYTSFQLLADELDHEG